MSNAMLTTYLAALFLGYSSASVTCLNRHGDPVDWFIVLKLHRDSASDNKLIRDGVAHVYMDESNLQWELSDVSLNDTKQPIGYTLQQIYQNQQSLTQNFGYMLYNDEWPNGHLSISKGHTKGSLAFDSSGGFWLVHSTPKFPEFANKSYYWPTNALVYGQSFLCVTYNVDQFELIGGQLLYNYPFMYDFNIPAYLSEKLPTLTKVAHGIHVDTSPWSHLVTLTSRGGINFKSFSKSTHFNEDLYADWLAPYLGTNLYTETWQNGINRLPSQCKTLFKVENIKLLNVPDILKQKETMDHSKWAVSSNSTNKWTCIGDINRMESQFKRAGGTVCTSIPGVWSAFYKLIEEIEGCG